MRKALLIAGMLLALLVWGMTRFFAPLTYGIAAEQFAEPQSAKSAEQLVEQVNTSAAKPNIIVILADDLGYGDVGSYGGEVIKTPAMDALAEQGMLFTSAYASAPICSPSRAGLLTGRYPLRSGIVHAIQAAGDSFMRKAATQIGGGLSNLASIDMRGGGNMVRGLPQVEITAPEALKQAGYRSAMFGKWHLGDFTEWAEYHPFNHGFDHFVGFNMSNDDWPVAFYRGEEKLIDDIGLDQQQYTGLFTQEAIKFIEQDSDKPFFIYLAHKDPHQPFFPSKGFAGKSQGGPYGDVVEEFDWSIGQIVEALKRNGMANNTLVLVTSDNGPWYEGATGDLRGRKGQSFEGGFRVPLIAWWPSVIAPSTSDTPVMNIDFFSTFLNLAGLSEPQDRTIDGRDLTPLLQSQPHSLGERALYFFHDYDIEAMRMGDWKYHASTSHYTWPNPLDKQDSFAGKLTSARNYTPPNSDQSVPTLGRWPLLYNLKHDRAEAYNVADHNPEITNKLGVQLKAWRAEFYQNPRAINVDGSGDK